MNEHELKRTLFIRGALIPGTAIFYFIISSFAWLYISDHLRSEAAFGTFNFIISIIYGFVGAFQFLKAIRLRNEAEEAAESLKRISSRQSTDDKWQQTQDDLTRADVARAMKHTFWLVEQQRARAAEIEALEKELMQLRNTIYESPDSDEEQHYEI